ncbi:MAG TPA: delta-60 repeat domain-containing protein, partial [Actinomycetota bacterium]
MLVTTLAAPSPALADAGDLDPTFGGGRVTTNLGSPDDGARSVVVQPDGRVVVVGDTRRARTGGDFAMIRYLTDGSLDPSFSGDGKRTTSFSPVYDAARDVALQPNGKIVVVGTAAMETRFAVARYLPDGSLDPSFHGDGKRTLNLSPSYDDAWAVAIQPDRRIVVAGYTGWGNFALARFMPNGSLDPSFGGDGRVVTSFGPGWDWAYDVALQANGKIVAVGRTDLGNGNFAVARYRRG